MPICYFMMIPVSSDPLNLETVEKKAKNTKGKDTNIKIKTRRTTKKEEKAEKEKKKAKKN